MYAQSNSNPTFIASAAFRYPPLYTPAINLSTSSHIYTQPWSGFLETILRPFPPDVRYNIQKALGGVAEAVGRMFPQQNAEVRHVISSS